MKSLLLSLLLLGSLKAQATPTACEINLSPSTVTKDQVGPFIKALMKHYDEDFKKNKIEPMPMFDWDNDSTDARVKFDGMYFHNIYLNGGMMRYHGMTIDTVALVVIHEIGHMLGEGPKSEDKARTAVEGEADYFSGQNFRKLAELGLLPDHSLDKTSALYLETKKYMQAQGITDSKTLELATRLGVAAQQLNKIQFNMIAEINQKSVETYDVSLLSPDTSVVEKTLTSYPSNQARLDTIIAGFLGRPRPLSWANPADFPTK